MRIAIQAADLDSERIDGTRVYLLNMLNRFGSIAPSDDFFVFHKKEFNSELTPKSYEKYHIAQKSFPFYWTQTRFAFELWKGNYDALWMPMQALPFLRRKQIKTTVTIHDLAFKYFPHFFPKKDLRRLNLFTDFAVRHADKIIAVSNHTKKNILTFYPGIREEKIKVIYHGFDSELFQKEISEEKSKQILESYTLKAKSYVLYAGAIQPRKNLEVLIDAFEKIRNLPMSDFGNIQLVLAGGKAWMWEDVLKRIEACPYKKDIIITGTIPFSDMTSLYRAASVFVFPSLYEGFGMPILEAFASGVPVISADNSSLREVGGDGALYFNEKNSDELSSALCSVLENKNLQRELTQKGDVQLQKFSWDSCAKETIEVIKR